MNGGGRERRWRVGIDNYGLCPLDLSPLGTLEWAAAHGADGVAFSGLTAAWHERTDAAALADLRAFAAGHGLYLEWGGAQHIPRDMTTWARRDLFAVNSRAAQEAAALGTRVVRSCSGGLMRWDAANPPTDDLLRDTAEALTAQRAMLSDQGVVLASVPPAIAGAGDATGRQLARRAADQRAGLPVLSVLVRHPRIDQLERAAQAVRPR